MKGLSTIIIGGLLCVTSVSFADDNYNNGTDSSSAPTSAATSAAPTTATKTTMDSNWICTTNASSSDAQTDKDADNKLANTAMSAADAFKMASDNCRDCTKITCEKQ